MATVVEGLGEVTNDVAQANFQRFIETMSKDQAKDLVRTINTFMKDLRRKAPEPESDSQQVQAFLTQMEGLIARHPLWANSTPEELEIATEALEKYLMTKLYDRTFSESAEDKERDQILSVRMAALQFIKPEHLEIAESLVDDPAIEAAKHALRKMSTYKAPRDKLVCILNCCRVVNNLLAVKVKDAAAGADDFTPVLIYITIKANPSHLGSNLSFIERYRMQSKLSSESQYYFIQMAGAASFIETLDASLLKVDQDEFIAHMLAAGALTDADLAMMHSSANSGQLPRRSTSPQRRSPVVTGTGAGLQMQALPTAGTAAGAGAMMYTNPVLQAHGQQQGGAAAAAAQAAGPQVQYVDFQQAQQQQQYQQQYAQQVQYAQQYAYQQQFGYPPAGYPASQPASNPGYASAQHYAVPPSAYPYAAYQQQQAPAAPQPPPPAPAPAPVYKSSAELEAEGLKLVLQSEASNLLQPKYQYLYSAPGDLSVKDVARLLEQYKEMVLKYEMLSQAVDMHASQHLKQHHKPASSSQQQQQQQQQGGSLATFVLPTTGPSTAHSSRPTTPKAPAAEAVPGPFANLTVNTSSTSSTSKAGGSEPQPAASTPPAAASAQSPPKQGSAGKQQQQQEKDPMYRISSHSYTDAIFSPASEASASVLSDLVEGRSTVPADLEPMAGGDSMSAAELLSAVASQLGGGDGSSGGVQEQLRGGAGAQGSSQQVDDLLGELLGDGDFPGSSPDTPAGGPAAAAGAAGAAAAAEELGEEISLGLPTLAAEHSQGSTAGRQASGPLEKGILELGSSSPVDDSLI